MLPCPCQAEDLTLQNLPIQGLDVSMGERKSITEKGDPQVSVAEVVMKEDPLPRTEG
jgi:NADPH-dependent 7-cyano-7-deazaguanine reductase QueF-like protein